MNIELPQTTKIQWCDHTANAWWGCTKVSPGCAHCYAETWSKRYDKGNGVWGKDAPRRAIKGVWSELEKWNKLWDGHPRRGVVFAQSMADTFEDHDGPVINHAGTVLNEENAAYKTSVPLLRAMLLDGIKQHTNLVYLLLTKRPENVRRMVPTDWLKEWPSNVMVGCSPCNQATAEASIPHLLEVPGPRFLSLEPLLGPVDISPLLARGMIHWVIVGGESGPGARPCNIAWIESIVNQCRTHGVPCFAKQLGARVVCRNDEVSEWLDECNLGLDYIDTQGVQMQGDPVRVKLDDPKGGDPSEWPSGLRVREFPKMLTERPDHIARTNKMVTQPTRAGEGA